MENKVLYYAQIGVILHNPSCNVMHSLVSYYALLIVILCAPWCNTCVPCVCAEHCVRG